MHFDWHSVAQTHTGKRRTRNEDAVLSRPEAGLWVVADGMGGHQAGEIASRAIAETLGVLELSGPLSEQVDALEDALLAVNDALRLRARRGGANATIGSTVVAMLAHGTTAVVLWAGDSRLYRYRDERLELITRDHNPVADLLDSGVVTEAEALAADTPIITRAVGGQPRLYLDVAVFDTAPHDTYLLCSDGLYRELELAEIAQALAAGAAADSVVDPRALAQAGDRLLAGCLAREARDNISLVLARAAPRVDARMDVP